MKSKKIQPGYRISRFMCQHKNYSQLRILVLRHKFSCARVLGTKPKETESYVLRYFEIHSVKTRYLSVLLDKFSKVVNARIGPLPFIPPPPVAYAHPIPEHVLIDSKSLCKNVARASGGANDICAQ